MGFFGPRIRGVPGHVCAAIKGLFARFLKPRGRALLRPSFFRGVALEFPRHPFPPWCVYSAQQEGVPVCAGASPIALSARIIDIVMPGLNSQAVSRVSTEDFFFASPAAQRSDPRRKSQ